MHTVEPQSLSECPSVLVGAVPQEFHDAGPVLDGRGGLMGLPVEDGPHVDPESGSNILLKQPEIESPGLEVVP